MKKIINVALIAIALVMITPLDAKRVTTIKVTPNEKEMFVNTKTLKQAETPAEKKEAAENLAKDIANDPIALLLLQKADILTEIAAKKNEIKKKGGYFGYLFVNEELQLLQKELQELEEELKDIEEDLIKLGAAQPEKVMNLKKWAVGTLITTVGIGIALQLAGYDVTGTLMTGAGTVAGKVGSALKAGWEYMPSFRSAAPTETQKSITTGTTPTTPTSITSSIGSAAIAVGGAAASFAATSAIEEAKKRTFDTALDYLLSLLEDNPSPKIKNATNEVLTSRAEYDKIADYNRTKANNEIQSKEQQ